ncbi:hypothetical protein K2Q16_03220 [Patescibacteria group bacterium]|nr:hypothetical protein [Patescibacteria group bacterium]
MDSNSTDERLSRLEAKVDAVHAVTEKTRTYLLVIMWSSLAMIVAPLLLAAILGPMLIASFSASLGI